MRPKAVVERVVDAIEKSGELPDSTNYVGYEPDMSSEAIKLPVVEASPTSEARISEHNTDEVGRLTDQDGNEVSRVYHALYQLTVEVSIWTAHGSRYDSRELGDSIYRALYQYDSSGPGRNLAPEVWRVRLGDGSPDDDLTTNPSLRRWTQDIDIWAYEEFASDEDYIINVVRPGSGDFERDEEEQDDIRGS